MAGHIQDRWYRTEPGRDGKPVKVKTDRHGVGMRYRARYVGPDGTEKSKSFADKQKRRAETWLANIEADMSRGDYIAPEAGKITFEQYAIKWMATQMTDPATRESVEMRLRRHAIPHIVKLLRNRPVFAPPKGGQGAGRSSARVHCLRVGRPPDTVPRGRGDVALEDGGWSTGHGVAHLPES